MKPSKQPARWLSRLQVMRILAVLFFSFSALIIAATTSTEPTYILNLTDTAFDVKLGSILAGEIVDTHVGLKNSSQHQINFQMTTCCGTIIEPKQLTINPGETGRVRIVFNPGYHSGPGQKVIKAGFSIERSDQFTEKPIVFSYLVSDVLEDDGEFGSYSFVCRHTGDPGKPDFVIPLYKSPGANWDSASVVDLNAMLHLDLKKGVNGWALTGTAPGGNLCGVVCSMAELTFSVNGVALGRRVQKKIMIHIPAESCAIPAVENVRELRPNDQTSLKITFSKFTCESMSVVGNAPLLCSVGFKDLRSDSATLTVAIVPDVAVKLTASLPLDFNVLAKGRNASGQSVSIIIPVVGLALATH